MSVHELLLFAFDSHYIRPKPFFLAAWLLLSILPPHKKGEGRLFSEELLAAPQVLSCVPQGETGPVFKKTCAVFE